MSNQPRLFFALPLSTSQRQPIVRWRDHALAESPASGRRVAAEDLHVTLAFLGSTPPQLAPALLGAAEGIAATAFGLTLDACEYWAKPQLLALTASDIPAPLATLAASLRELSAQLGLHRAKLDYRPHLTLVRDLPLLPALPQAPQFTFTAPAFSLFESVLGRQGPRYIELARWPLRIAP